VRAIAVEIAWGWLQHQPQSEFSQWYQRKFGHGGSALRRKGIVALARKLLVALRKYAEYDELPAGAALKA
jgi:transposase